MRDIICSGNEEHFDYLIKREATILQKRIRTEVALGLQTKEEGCGKGFYEKTMRRLLGTHAMQLSNPEHIIGKFNPHLETLLRVTADEALFVGDPKHRNALFGLITEPTLTIEPKGCGVYTAASYLNTDDHSATPSTSCRSATRRGGSSFRPCRPRACRTHAYFAALQEELDNGGYEALLYHLLHEVDLDRLQRPRGAADGRLCGSNATTACRRWRRGGVELLETGTLWGADPSRASPGGQQQLSAQVKIATIRLGGKYLSSGTSTSSGSTIRPGRSSHACGTSPATTASGVS